VREVRVGIITSPVGEAGRTPLSNLLEVVAQGSDLTYVVTGNAALRFFQDNPRAIVSGIHFREGAKAVSRIFKNSYMQLRLALLVLEGSAWVDAWVFFIGGEALIIPMMMAKFTRKTVLLALAGSDEKSMQSSGDKFSRLLGILSNIGRGLADQLVVYSPRLVKEWRLQPYAWKVSIAHHHFVDFTRFKVTRSLENRDKVVGFVGRLDPEKGILEFVRAMSLAIKGDPSLRFIIAGSGRLEERVRDEIFMLGIGKVTRMVGWVSHNDLPDLLNELRLLVLPSFTEGLPNILLEAMACGTPVLSTGVGSVPDVITEGETGFLMDSNSPETIAQSVVRVLGCPDFEVVARRALDHVVTNFTLGNAVDAWTTILAEQDRGGTRTGRT